jgi:membrane-bound lytic murein transglycosylase B
MKPAVALLAAALALGAPIGLAHAAARNNSHHHAAVAKARAAQAAKAKAAKAKAAKNARSMHKPEPVPEASKVVERARVAGTNAEEVEHVNFAEWQAVRDFEDEMVSKHGFDRAALDTLVAQLRFVDSAVQLVRPAPPGKPKNWHAYSERFIEPVRIGAGVRFWNENADALARAEKQYGVPAEIIVGILGVETLYGRDTGRFRVVDTLATLAFAYPETPNRDERMAFFRGELENTLLLARQENIDPLSLLGSFAGAVGMPQFMPGSILQYGVDFDGDGRVDLRDSSADAIGSVANFLVQHGWNRDEQGPPVFAADVSPRRAWEDMLGRGLSPRYRADELTTAGVITDVSLPADRLYGLVDLQNGADPTEYWVANGNFFAITNYNRSYFYAMSVVELGRAVRLSRDI